MSLLEGKMAFAVLYFLIAVLATTVGAITGIGGGIIIKPVLDVLGHYDVETIGFLSAVTVLAMSLVAVGRQLLRGMKINGSIALPLTGGSVLGGIIGQAVLRAILAATQADSAVTALQNAVLALLILAVHLYMRNREQMKSPMLTSLLPAFFAGIFLGVTSSFLGIGGGPINVALILFLFSFDMKTAAVCSLFTVLFAQVSKLASILVSTGFGGFPTAMLPPMVIGAVAGGFIGTELNKRLPEKMVERCFNGIQLFVFLIALLNIVRNLL